MGLAPRRVHGTRPRRAGSRSGLLCAAQVRQHLGPLAGRGAVAPQPLRLSVRCPSRECRRSQPARGGSCPQQARLQMAPAPRTLAQHRNPLGGFLAQEFGTVPPGGSDSWWTHLGIKEEVSREADSRHPGLGAARGSWGAPGRARGQVRCSQALPDSQLPPGLAQVRWEGQRECLGVPG